MLLGSICEGIFCRAALERQETAKGAGELEVEGDFVAGERVALGGGFESLDGSYDGGGRIRMAGHGSVHGKGFGLDYLELSPVRDCDRVDQMGFDRVAGAQGGHKASAELDEGGGGILGQGLVRGGEAVAGAVAGGIALALDGVMGPLEQAPLAREAWICFRDLILI